MPKNYFIHQLPEYSAEKVTNATFSNLSYDKEQMAMSNAVARTLQIPNIPRLDHLCCDRENAQVGNGGTKMMQIRNPSRPDRLRYDKGKIRNTDGLSLSLAFAWENRASL